jgi:hypothetical protein
MWRRVVGLVVHVSKDRSAFIFRIKLAQNGYISQNMFCDYSVLHILIYYYSILNIPIYDYSVLRILIYDYSVLHVPIYDFTYSDLQILKHDKFRCKLQVRANVRREGTLYHEFNC